MTIIYEDEWNQPMEGCTKEQAEQIINAVLDAEECPYECEINVLLTDGASIHEMNREFRGIDRTTDVLSFPAVDFPEAGMYSFLEKEENEYCFDPESGELILGDMALSAEKVMEQAKEYGHSTRREFSFLIAHSMLHLLGYDHETPEEAQVMEEKQANVLDQLGITR